MQVTIVTGASRGIGKAIAEDLKSLDHKFIYLSSSDVDFKYPMAVFHLVEERLKSIKEEIEQINIVLCAAQIGSKNCIATEEISNLYNINLLSNLNVIEAALCIPSKMRIVWFAGGGAAFPYPEFFGYSLSKVAVVRAVENLSLILKDSSIIALAPGAVDTDMLKIVEEAGCKVRTRTDISEPVNFVRRFITDEMDSLNLNGKFLHVRDTLNIQHKDIFTLRRIE